MRIFNASCDAFSDSLIVRIVNCNSVLIELKYKELFRPILNLYGFR